MKKFDFTYRNYNVKVRPHRFNFRVYVNDDFAFETGLLIGLYEKIKGWIDEKLTYENLRENVR